MNRYVKGCIIGGINIGMIYFLYSNFSNYTHDFSLNELELSAGDGNVGRNLVGINNTEETRTASESYVESMKNLLLNKLRQNININDSIIHINLETSTIDKALAEALTDSSEIDLSPPRPIINTKGMKNMSNMVSFKVNTINIMNHNFPMSKVQYKEVMYTRKNLLKSKCLSKKKRQILNYRVFYPLPVRNY